MPDPAASGELWACRRRTPEARFHTGVHARTVGGETMWVALFPQVDEGEYSLLTDLWEEGVHFVVTGGEVTTIDL